MAPKKWLNILVDGSSALGPYWPNIVSEYLEKIVRTFFYNSIEEMFPRPSNVMTAQEYYNGERHCVVVAARDPFPTRMLVSVPEITKEGIIGTNLHYVNADFYEVAEMFGPANDGSIVSTSPICSTRMDQFTVLLSRKFKEAHDAFRGKRIMDPSTEEWIESMKRTNNTRFPINFANHCQAMVSTTPTLTAGEGSSKGVVMEERDNMGVLGGMSMLPGSTGNSLNVQPYATNNGGGGGGGHQHFQFGRSAVGSSTRAPPASATPQFNHTNTLPFSPSFTNFQPYVHAWEGCLVGNIHNNRSSILIAKALKRETSPLTIYSEPVDYVFFSIMQFNNLDLYEHLKNKKLCAKIRLPSQTLILSATESKDHYIGTIFLGVSLT
ncbi:hypothetical protein LR48_Vigan10g018500 [Vigna angularis]|uniref:Mediator of RNA polymerase II transcription subunit 25 n=1 Tax=Phaseolus angularis TaxID=3914 RepID=A0A0L9VH26_PHAAN|nr:hypothetical protein LR48_Vigan10g018500 [Vigna angularis]